MRLTPQELAEVIGRVASAQQASELHVIARELRERWPKDEGTPVLLRLIERRLSRLHA